MRRDEVSALGDLVAVAASSVADQARATHSAIAARVFANLGPSAAGVRIIHDRVSDAAYAGARKLSGTLVRAGARALSLARPPDAPSIDESVSGRLALGALNGAVGDTLQRRDNPLATAMTLRARGRDLVLGRDSLASELPAAGPALAIFVHGLGETDDGWRLGADRHLPYGDRLQSELGYVSLYVRYNSGLHVSHNGRRLAQLLDQLTRCWPVEVQEIALIGHSMGGLIARSACHYGSAEGWKRTVGHVFTLGTPHRGAPLERAANAACSGLSLLPETRAFAGPLRARSAGIKDLRYGYLTDEDWLHSDPDSFLANTGREIPFLPSANHYFICATLSSDPDAPLARILGDLLVLRSSAWDQARRGQRMRFAIDNYRHLGGATHFDLLNHPAIYEQIKIWLTAAPKAAVTQRP